MTDTKALTTELKEIVPEPMFTEALNHLCDARKYVCNKETSVTWVNWREKEFQIKVSWHGSLGLMCYLNFFSISERDCALKALFNVYAKSGEKPFIEQGHGWTKARYGFVSNDTLTINALANKVAELGYHFTIIYNQEYISARSAFDVMGIPLVPGERGKELIDGIMKPYYARPGKNL